MKNGTNGHNSNGGTVGGGLPQASRSGVRTSLRLLQKHVEQGSTTFDEDAERIRLHAQSVMDDPNESARTKNTAAQLLQRLQDRFGDSAKFLESRETAELSEQEIRVRYVNTWERKAEVE